jgi:hypothetical protein
MNAFGDAAEHRVLSAMPDKLAARDAIAKGVKVDVPKDAPALTGAPTPLRLWRLARYMRGFDLVLTYNWGAFDAVMARRVFGGPPLIHHEDGFNEDEVERLKPQPLSPAGAEGGKSWCRRRVAKRCAALLGEELWHPERGAGGRLASRRSGCNPRLRRRATRW